MVPSAGPLGVRRSVAAMGAPERSSSVRRRSLIMGGLLSVVLVVAVAAWLAGSRVRSSEQAAADAAPPGRSVVMAPVELRVLASTVVSRGDVVPALSTAVVGPRPAEGSEALVTGLFVEVGAEVVEGSRIVEVSGRPVFVFEGGTPAFRALRPAMRGADVAALQAGLARLGCEAGDSGVFDQATKACVEGMYVDAGYEVVLGSETEESDLAEARRAVADMEDELVVVEAELVRASAGPSVSDVHSAEVAVAATERGLRMAVAERDAAIAEATRTVDDGLASLNGQLVAANPAAASAAGGQAGSTSSGGAPSGGTPAQGGSPTGSGGGSSGGGGSPVGERERAAHELASALTEVEVAHRDGDAAVAAADEALGSAEVQLAELTAAPDVSAEEAAVSRQSERVVEAAGALTGLEAVSGATVPLGEVVFVPSLPATVDSLVAVVGESGGGSAAAAADGGDDEPTVSSGPQPLLVLSSAGLQVEVGVAPADRALLQTGMAVELLDELSGVAVTGELVSVGDDVVLDPGGGQRFEAVVTADRLPVEWSGRNVRVTFTAAATEGDELVVPLAAVSAGADGQARVQVQRDETAVSMVAVSAGLSADGFVAVTPADSAALVEGDRVVVGR